MGYSIIEEPCFVCRCEDELHQPRGTQSHPINCGWKKWQETELVVDDFILRIKGIKRMIGRKYKVLSITLTDVYIQDVVTNRCNNYSRYWLSKDFVKIR